MEMEREILQLIKRIIRERVDEHGVILFDVEKVNELAVEMGLDVSCVRRIFEEINKILEEKFREKSRSYLP